MKDPHQASKGTGKTQPRAVDNSLADQPCPNALLCNRWSATDGGSYCRLRWREFTNPKPSWIVEGRA